MLEESAKLAAIVGERKKRSSSATIGPSQSLDGILKNLQSGVFFENNSSNKEAKILPLSPNNLPHKFFVRDLTGLTSDIATQAPFPWEDSETK